jgi:hypothetical protein
MPDISLLIGLQANKREISHRSQETRFENSMAKSSLLYWGSVIAGAGTTLLVLASICLIPWLGRTLYKYSYLAARKQEIVDFVTEYTPPNTPITVSQAHIIPPPPRSDGWFLDGWLCIRFTLTLEAKEDLPDSFDLYEDLSSEPPSIQRVSCRTPEKLGDEEAGTSAYELVCFSWARCSAPRCLLLLDWEFR